MLAVGSIIKSLSEYLIEVHLGVFMRKLLKGNNKVSDS